MYLVALMIYLISTRDMLFDFGPALKASLIRRNHMQTNYNLRNSHTDLARPKPKLWNSLPIDTKLVESIHLFKSHLKLNSNVRNSQSIM